MYTERRSLLKRYAKPRSSVAYNVDKGQIIDTISREDIAALV